MVAFISFTVFTQRSDLYIGESELPIVKRIPMDLGDEEEILGGNITSR